jgi:hypothetical protein
VASKGQVIGQGRRYYRCNEPYETPGAAKLEAVFRFTDRTLRDPRCAHGHRHQVFVGFVCTAATMDNAVQAVCGRYEFRPCCCCKAPEMTERWKVSADHSCVVTFLENEFCLTPSNDI